jgi:hypothetical protein
VRITYFGRICYALFPCSGLIRDNFLDLNVKVRKELADDKEKE